MNRAVISLGIVAAIVVGTILLGTFLSRRRERTPQEFIVGGRSFGALFLWLLLAGEIYTTFTFLGAAGWAYGKGAPAFYILCYGVVAYILSYFMLPPIWRYAREHGLLTGPDFLAARYESKTLGFLVALVCVFFLVPYVTLQLSGVALLLHIAGYNTLDSTLTVSIAFILIALFVFLNGLRGTAWGSVVKDILVLASVIFAGIVLPIHFFGSPAAMIGRVLAQKPDWMTLAGSGANGPVWFVSTVLLTSLGFYMWPQSLAATYSARNEETIRKNAIFLPFYQLMLLLVYFAGFTALLVVPGLKASAADQSFMLVVQQYYPPWVLGLVAGAGALAGLVPASAQLLAAASVFSKNVLAPIGIATGDRAQLLATRILVLVVAALALGFWIIAKTTLVGLLLIAYNGITQLFPGVVFTLLGVRANALGVGAGILVGLALLAYFTAVGTTTILGLNIGFFALIGNAIVAFAVSTIVPHRRATSSTGEAAAS